MNKKKKLKPGRVNGKNSEHRSKKISLPKKLRYELSQIFEKHLKFGAKKDKILGQETIEKRKGVILGFFGDLYKLGFKIESVKSLKQKHLQAVFRHLEKVGQSPSTIQNKISIMRTFCEWAGKPGMVRSAEFYVEDPMSVKRSTVAQEDKSWEGNGVDAFETIAKIWQEDKMAAAVLLLCVMFGLRIREAVLLNLFKAVDNGNLHVVKGTKGGRPRFVPIEMDEQDKTLEKVREIVDPKFGNLVTHRGVEATIQHIYYVMRKHGLTLADLGVSAHGLRHQYFHESFYRLLGVEPPIRGGDVSVIDKGDLKAATGKLMERGGHSRESIGRSYYGSNKQGAKQPRV